MDKEYTDRLEEVEKLISEGKTEDAVDSLDDFNWHKVHNINALVKASELYEELGQMDSAKDLLAYAHERSPIGRTVLYHLALICIRMNDLEEAKEYYDEFVEIAPHDSKKYLIKYQLNKARGGDDYGLINILEEYLDVEFMDEKWAYELACLYHRTSQIEKCIGLCDKICLYFGDGPYVERALELKMLYSPLDEAQEEKYRTFQLERRGVMEVKANESLDSGEIVAHTITIPKVELSPDRFNTINLQAEIKKNIQEIMEATETGEIHENLEAIKDLVEEIPYVTLPEDSADSDQETDQNKALDESLKSSFQEYLVDEYDGQMSLFIPEEGIVEEQVAGQMTIEEVMENWAKTKRAAEAALQDAKEQKFEQTKAKALKEANQIMNRLTGVMPKLDAGVAPAELLKEAYLSASELAAESASELAPASETFSIPRLASEGQEIGVGLEIPVVHPEGEKVIKAVSDEAEPTTIKACDAEDTEEWNPPVLDEKEETDVDALEASKIIEDVNNMLQQEIDRLTLDEEDGEDKDTKSVEINMPEVTLEEALLQEAMAVETPVSTMTVEEEEEDEVLTDRLLEEAVSEENNAGEPTLEEIKKQEVEDQIVRAVDETALEAAVGEDMPLMELTADEKELFEYFLPITGMEKSICQVLTGARQRLAGSKNSATGNIMIQGGRGSGKTSMATSFIKVLQNEIGKPNGNVGKIDAERLNEKDAQALFEKVKGGCLIIENAGGLSRDTMVTLSLLMDSDRSGLLVILEDGRIGLERIKNECPQFVKKFTERITIPVFTVDELVHFGQTYAKQEGYGMDEMGVLALYDRIGLIQHFDRPTYLSEVKEIVDDAIDRAERGGLGGFFGRLGSKRVDEEGNLILMEKDFQN